MSETSPDRFAVRAGSCGFASHDDRGVTLDPDLLDDLIVVFIGDCAGLDGRKQSLAVTCNPQSWSVDDQVLGPDLGEFAGLGIEHGHSRPFLGLM